MRIFTGSRFLTSFLTLGGFMFGSLFSQERMPVIKDELRTQHSRMQESQGERSLNTVPRMIGTNDVLVNNNNGSQSDSCFTQSETGVIAFGNHVVIGFNDAGSYYGGNNQFTGWAYSTDGGVTFTDGGTLPVSTVGDVGDPVLARDETMGRIYFSTCGFESPYTIQMWCSDDNGATWMAPVNATPGGYVEDKPWLTVDNFSGPGNGNVYLISRRFGFPGQGIYVYRSTDHGATFGPSGGVNIVSNNQGSFIAVGPDHTVYAFWWHEGYSGDFIRMRKSTDLGQTFGATITVASGLVGGVNGDLGLTGKPNGLTNFSSFRSNSFAHVAINPVNGHIYAVYNDDAPAADKADVFLTISTDGGTTWSARIRVNDDATTTDQWQPTIAVTPSGSGIGIFYYSRQEDPTENNRFKYYGRIGAVAGTTVYWRPSFAVSAVASLPEFGRDRPVSSNYMGDYNHVAATTDAFHVVWSDNRDDLPGGAPRKDPNVYYKNIPITDVTVYQRLQDGTQVGTIGRWNGTSFDPRFSSGLQLPFRIATTEALQGKPNIVSAQKYRVWNDLLSDVTNHHVFDITTFTGNLTSNFSSTTPTITIKTDLIDLPGTTGGNIEFRDPWYIDYQDASYGNNYRNCGMSGALWRERSSPFTPDNEVIHVGESPYPYNGVFLGQGYPNWDPPYYSVGAINQLTIGGYDAAFQYWSGTDVLFQYGSEFQTGVVFQQTGATAVAKYKAYLHSASSSATAYNAEQKMLARSDGTLEMMYEGSGNVWWHQSTDNGSTWATWVPLVGHAGSTLLYRGATGVAYQDAAYYACERAQLNAGNWIHSIMMPYFQAYDVAQFTAPQGQEATPSLAIAKGESADPLLLLVWRDAEALRYSLIWLDGTILVTDDVPDSRSTSIHPAVGGVVTREYSGHPEWHFYVVWEESGAIYAERLTVSSSGETITWGAKESLTGEYTELFSSLYPSVVVRSVDDNTAIPHVFWHSRITKIEERPTGGTPLDPGTYSYNIFTRSSDGSQWSPLTQLQHGTHDEFYPSLAIRFGPDTLQCAWQCEGHVAFAGFPLADEKWGSIEDIAPDGLYPNIASGVNATFGVWAQPGTPLQTIQTYVRPGEASKISAPANSGALGKAQAYATKLQGQTPVRESRRGSLDLSRLRFPGDKRRISGSQWVTVEQYMHTTGSVDESLAFSDSRDTTLRHRWLGSEPFTIEAADDSVKGSITIVLCNVRHTGEIDLNPSVVLLEVADAVSDEPLLSLYNLRLREMLRWGVPDTIVVQRIGANVGMLQGRSVRIKTRLLSQLVGEFQPSWSEILTTPVGEPTASSLTSAANAQGGVPRVPTEFGLDQNYPNPFNPTTVIRYQVPEKSAVVIKLYDVLGRELQMLVDEMKEPGYYQFEFNASSLPSGVYFYRMRAGEHTSVKKLVLMK